MNSTHLNDTQHFVVLNDLEELVFQLQGEEFKAWTQEVEDTFGTMVGRNTIPVQYSRAVEMLSEIVNELKFLKD